MLIAAGAVCATGEKLDVRSKCVPRIYPVLGVTSSSISLANAVQNVSEVNDTFLSSHCQLLPPSLWLSYTLTAIISLIGALT